VALNIANVALFLGVYVIFANVFSFVYWIISGGAYNLPNVGFLAYAIGLILLVLYRRELIRVSVSVSTKNSYNSIKLIGGISCFLALAGWSWIFPSVLNWQYALHQSKEINPAVLARAKGAYTRYYQSVMGQLNHNDYYFVNNVTPGDNVDFQVSPMGIDWKGVTSGSPPIFTFSSSADPQQTIHITTSGSMILKEGITFANWFDYKPVKVTIKILHYTPATLINPTTPFPPVISFQETVRALALDPNQGTQFKSLKDNVWDMAFSNMILGRKINQAEMCKLDPKVAVTEVGSNGASVSCSSHYSKYNVNLWSILFPVS
jgi:hypothetical protein